MAGAMTWWRVKDGPVGAPGPDGFGTSVVEFQDQLLGAELAEILRLFLAAPECVEGVHHVLDLIPLKAIQVKVRGIEFDPDQGPAVLIPPERRTRVFHVPGKGL